MTLIPIVLCSRPIRQSFCDIFTRKALFCLCNACLYDGGMIAPELVEFGLPQIGLIRPEVGSLFVKRFVANNPDAALASPTGWW